MQLSKNMGCLFITLEKKFSGQKNDRKSHVLPLLLPDFFQSSPKFLGLAWYWLFCFFSPWVAGLLASWKDTFTEQEGSFKALLIWRLLTRFLWSRATQKRVFEAGLSNLRGKIWRVNGVLFNMKKSFINDMYSCFYWLLGCPLYLLKPYIWSFFTLLYNSEKINEEYRGFVIKASLLYTEGHE